MTSKLISTLSDETFCNTFFKQDYVKLLKSVLSNGSHLDESEIQKLLKTAAIFSLSENENYKHLATKITVLILKEYKNKFKWIPFVVETILTRLGDLPTISYMVEKNHGADFFSYFTKSDFNYGNPLSFPEVQKRKIFNQIDIGGHTANFTDFQTKIFQWLDNGKSLAFSAPTSAGKSYVIHNYIIQKILKETEYNVVYLVPTKSLIFEVQKSILNRLRDLGVNSKEAMVVTSGNLTIIKQLGFIKKKVFVLTQERLQQMLSYDTNLHIDLLVVDEAQKINDGSRGVILEDAVEDLLQSHPTQSVFIVPNVSNPQKFQNIFDVSDSFKSEKTSRTPVSQNIFLVDFNKKDVSLTLTMKEFDDNLVMKTIPTKLESREKTQYGLKAWTATNILVNQDHTLIYCNGPQECILISERMKETLPEINEDRLSEAIKFLETHVHPEYYLVDHLRYGIGYHYGNMPQFVRFVVKDLFDNKLINYLCCTSTLLEGVNLPANNIILHKPKSGNLNPMDTGSILNLSGRAGRLGKDYYGNVYCINLDQWDKGQDAFDGNLDEVKSAVEKTLSEDFEQLLSHLEQYDVPPRGEKNIETVATSLIIKKLKDQNFDFESFFKKYPDITNENIQKIVSKLTKIENSVSSLSKSIILKNRGIDPRLQHDLYVYLKKIEYRILPPHPTDEFFKNHLKLIFKLISEYLLKDKSKSYRYYTKIASMWIRQKTYKRILEQSLWYEEKIKLQHPLVKNEINNVIDELDKILERRLKFDYSKAMQCYCDIIEHILSEENSQDDFCKELANFLEAGAYNPKILLLMNIGLSRNNAISLSYVVDDDITTAIDALEWLRTHKDEIRENIKNDMAYREIEYLLES